MVRAKGGEIQVTAVTGPRCRKFRGMLVIAIPQAGEFTDLLACDRRAVRLKLMRDRMSDPASCQQTQFISPREHAPGPRGSPHDPQAPLGDAEADDPFADTAKTDSCGSSLVVWHLGHSAFSLP